MTNGKLEKQPEENNATLLQIGSVNELILITERNGTEIILTLVY